MKYQNIIKQYCDTLQRNDIVMAINLFAKEAKIISPTLGTQTPEEFLSYIDKTIRSKVTLREFFISQSSPNRIAAYLSVDNIYQDTKVVTEAIDIFEFDQEDKIQKIEMFYDPSVMRKFLEQLKII